jgi:hypothetical protein
MKKIDFLGNPSSPHVRHWEMVLRANGMEPLVHGIAQHIGEGVLVQRASSITPFCTKNISIEIAYVLAGLLLRIRKWTGSLTLEFFHAHNTSGYGLTAWLSGVPYGITTYGTEIFNASNRSILYRYLIKKVLQRSVFITSSSPKMTETLVNIFLVNRSKIYEIYLGISPVFQYSFQARLDFRKKLDIPTDAKVWIVNRRMHSIYQTLEVVRAFGTFCANHSHSHSHAHLILIEGDADPDYSKLVSKEAGMNNNIHIVRGFLNQEKLCDLLCAADFAISVPKSDQLSSSILEAMQCNVLPVLANLQSYKEVESVAITIDIDPNKLQSNILSMFAHTVNYTHEDLKFARESMRRKISEINNFESIGRMIHALYKH